jgi:hypothetical protein
LTLTPATTTASKVLDRLGEDARDPGFELPLELPLDPGRFSFFPLADSMRAARFKRFDGVSAYPFSEALELAENCRISLPAAEADCEFFGGTSFRGIFDGGGRPASGLDGDDLGNFNCFTTDFLMPVMLRSRVRMGEDLPADLALLAAASASEFLR